jgi:hypothetical protein
MSLTVKENGSKVVLSLGAETTHLTLKEALRLQADLSLAVASVFESKLVRCTGAVVMPGDVAWDTTIAEVVL